MPNKRNLLRLLIVMLLFVGCMDHYDRTKVFTNHFWTSSESNVPSHLYLNGKDMGVIPYREVQPGINDPQLKRTTLRTRLRSGKYQVEVRDVSGDTHYKGVMKVRFSDSGLSVHTSSKYNEAGTHVVIDANALFTEIWY